MFDHQIAERAKSKSALTLTANAGLLGIGVLTLTPAYAAVILHSPTNGYVLVNAANGLGAVMAAFLMG
jgi:hypothetical protein